MRALPVLLLLLQAPPALAEGARLSLDCGRVSTCTDSGACRPAGGPVDLTFSPRELDGDGIGTWGVSLNEGAEAEAHSSSATGPWVWMAEEESRWTLILSSERSALLHRQDLGDPVWSEIDFLSCEVLQ